MIRCVPAMFGYIQSAGKRKRIIDDDDFLMMRRSDGMAIVEPEMDPPVSAPGMSIERNDFTIRREDHREIPQQHINPKSTIATHQTMQKIPETWSIGISSIKPKPAIELPTSNKNKTLCVL